MSYLILSLCHEVYDRLRCALNSHLETFLIHSLSHFCKLETGESDPIAYNMSFCITRRKVETHKRKLDSLSAVLAVSLQLLKSGYCCHLEAIICSVSKK